ncbi:hypothetical protein TBCH5v1_2161 [Thermococcus barophilus]|uniref:Uncharacterized protein n=1 Tax=Thermococcus barophilus TaxID=55802 RepID=A0A0S1XE94_THEBA|nr:hypothetical protein TBCH5v1_2161 [Thermococcus barophilus]
MEEISKVVTDKVENAECHNLLEGFNYAIKRNIHNSNLEIM